MILAGWFIVPYLVVVLADVDPLPVAIVTTIGSVMLGLITLVVNIRNSRTQAVVAQTASDQATRIEEWDRLLKNCRAENDRVSADNTKLRSEVNYYRERYEHQPGTD